MTCFATATLALAVVLVPVCLHAAAACCRPCCRGPRPCTFLLSRVQALKNLHHTRPLAMHFNNTSDRNQSIAFTFGFFVVPESLPCQPQPSYIKPSGGVDDRVHIAAYFLPPSIFSCTNSTYQRTRLCVSPCQPFASTDDNFNRNFPQDG